MSSRYLISIFVAAFSVLASFADAENDVITQLKRAGLETGYDKAKQRFVVVGTAEREVPNLSGASFDKTRNDLGKIAALNARCELMFMLDLRMKSSEVSDMTVKSGKTINQVRSIIEMFSKVKLTGCKMLCSAESYDKASGLYQIAVAIGWSQKSLASANKQINDGWSDVDDEDVYVAWCKKNDLAAMIGSRDFTDADGLKRYVGIGVSDVEGLTGGPLAMAVKKSVLKAKENLAYSLAIDSAVHDVAKRYVTDFSNGDTEARIVWEKFENEAIAKCRIVLRNQKEVYSVTVKNPVTGRNMYVSVYGITAAK